eukprot:scaffold237_cov233-Pinguiococcus_pyrenoidosus.AAC.2
MAAPAQHTAAPLLDADFGDPSAPGAAQSWGLRSVAVHAALHAPVELLRSCDSHLLHLARRGCQHLLRRQASRGAVSFAPFEWRVGAQRMRARHQLSAIQVDIQLKRPGEARKSFVGVERRFVQLRSVRAAWP